MIDERSIKRKQLDEDNLEASFKDLAAAVTGKRIRQDAGHSTEDDAKALNRILAFLHKSPVSFKEGVSPLTQLLDMGHVSVRTVTLEGAWYKDAVGAYLGYLTDGRAVALLPRGVGYAYFDEQTGKYVRINKHNRTLLQQEAQYFYVPLPDGKLTVKDLYTYMAKALSIKDYLMIIGAALLASVIAMIIPAMTKLVFSGLIPSGSVNLILPVFVLMMLAMFSSHIINIMRTQAINVINVRAGTALQAAGMARVMAMPTSFFRRFSSGELASRLSNIDQLTTATLNAVFSSGLTGIFSLIYIGQISRYAPGLVIPAIVVIILQTALSFACVAINIKRSGRRLRKQSKLSGFTLSVINGVQKVRFSGAENRIYSKWAKQYKEIAELTYQPPKLVLYSKAINSLISIIGLAVIYYIAANQHVTTANYMAFNSAYSMVAGAFLSLTSIVSTIADFKPMLDMIKPILETAPEIETGKPVPESLSGKISLSHISFRYQKEGAYILDDINIDIEPGEYIGIVGATGCGKSTLMRIMLGFEKPDQGTVYYDDQDISALSLRGLRQKIGTVLQNGQLIQGSVFNNLMISRPELTEEEAWEALEMAALADDVRKMPMKLSTILSENGGGFSGGQKQRLLIARALVGKPAVVFMDEATSALDNLAQAHTVKALDSLNCTRVVIAHRLSTIQNCSRIIMLEKGHIVEEGTYQELIDKKGKFAALVERQRLDT